MHFRWEQGTRFRAELVCSALAVLAFAGCGGTKKVATTTATTTTATTSASRPPGPPVKSMIYKLELTSTSELPAGVPKGSARAVITLDAATDEICWMFSQLKNVTRPTEAEITGHPTFGVTRTLLAHPFAALGCGRYPALLLGILEREPQRFEVGIQNRHHPGRAVRARL